MENAVRITVSGSYEEEEAADGGRIADATFITVLDCNNHCRLARPICKTVKDLHFQTS